MFACRGSQHFSFFLVEPLSIFIFFPFATSLQRLSNTFLFLPFDLRDGALIFSFSGLSQGEPHRWAISLSPSWSHGPSAQKCFDGSTSKANANKWDFLCARYNTTTIITITIITEFLGARGGRKNSIPPPATTHSRTGEKETLNIDVVRKMKWKVSSSCFNSCWPFAIFEFLDIFWVFGYYYIFWVLMC